MEARYSQPPFLASTPNPTVNTQIPPKTLKFKGFGGSHREIGTFLVVSQRNWKVRAKLEGADTRSQKMLGEVWSELEVDLPADVIWAVYSNPDLPRLIVELMPTRFKSIDVIEGDGTQGTILHVTRQPSNSGSFEWKEQFVLIDAATRTKVINHISGGFLDIGFTMFQNIFKVTPRGADACTIRTTTLFDVKKGSESRASLISPSWEFPMAIRDYAIQQKALKTNKS